MPKIDYEAKIEDLKGARRIKQRERQSTALIDNKMSRYRTLQIKAEMKAEAKREKEAAQ